MFVEDVEKVCDVVELFIETGQVSTDKDLCIPLNKKLRNAEIKQFVYNIIRYNEKENLDAELFLQTAFGEWFNGKKRTSPRTTTSFQKILWRQKRDWKLIWNDCAKNCIYFLKS